MKQAQVIAAVIKRHDRFLICQRPSHKRHGDLWEFPGGKLEPGETFLEAARRELDEELGITVSRVGALLLSVGDPGSEFVINFVEVEAEGEPTAIEHQALKWLPCEELLKLFLAPSDRQFVEHLSSKKKR